MFHGSIELERHEVLHRKIDMANKLDEFFQNDGGQTYFVMVGSAHVVIDPSVPGELEKKGYKIERIY
ncbi:TraB/GumN family protein [Paenibacillus enshidis]